MKHKFLTFILLLSSFFFSSLSSQPVSHHSSWDMVAVYDLTDAIPYVGTAVAVGSLVVSGCKYVCDLWFGQSQGQRSSSYNSKRSVGSGTDGHWHDSSDYSMYQVETEPVVVDPFEQFRRLEKECNFYHPGASVSGTIFTEYKRYKDPKYRAYLRSQPDFEGAIFRLYDYFNKYYNQRCKAEDQKLKITKEEWPGLHESDRATDVLGWVCKTRLEIQKRRVQAARSREERAAKSTRERHRSYETNIRDLVLTGESDSLEQCKNTLSVMQRQITSLQNDLAFESDQKSMVIAFAKHCLDDAMVAIDRHDLVYFDRLITRKNALLKTIEEGCQEYEQELAVSEGVQESIGPHIDLAAHRVAHGTSADHEIRTETIEVFEGAAQVAGQHPVRRGIQEFTSLVANLGEGVRVNWKLYSYNIAYSLLDVAHGIVQVAARSIQHGCQNLMRTAIDHPIETIIDLGLCATMPQVALTKMLCTLVIKHEEIAQLCQELKEVMSRDPKEGLAVAGGYLFEMFVVHQCLINGPKFGGSMVSGLEKGISKLPRAVRNAFADLPRIRTNLPVLERVGRNLRHAVTRAMQTADYWAGLLNESFFHGLGWQSVAAAHGNGVFDLKAVEEEVGSLKSQGVSASVSAESQDGLSILYDLLRRAKPMKNADPMHQLAAFMEDGTQVVFRRDIGKYAHRIGQKYPKPTPHYNIEFQRESMKPRPKGTPPKYKTIKKLHIILDNAMNVIDYF